MRPIDKANRIQMVLEAASPGRRHNPKDNGNTYVVSTQSMEIGIDASFDFLISECAPMDSLVHRFSRLDRQGDNGSKNDAKGVIFGGKHSSEDVIYGPSITATWDYLTSNSKDEMVDMGHLSDVRKDVPASCLSERTAHEAPMILDTMVENWVQTNPSPQLKHSVYPFIRGYRRTWFRGSVYHVEETSFYRDA